MNFKERLLIFLKHLGIGQTKFEENTKLGRASISKIKNGMSAPNLAKISSAYPELNIDWLLSGEGTMLKSENNTLTPIKTTNQGVPYYNVDFIGGFDLVENDQTTVPDYYIDFQKYNNADCWCNVTGHSMEPSISHGDIIALKEIIDWRIFLPFGEIYAIVTPEHRTIKKVTGSLNPEKFLLIPLNSSTEFQPQEIPISIIMKVYKVLGCVKKF